MKEREAKREGKRSEGKQKTPKKIGGKAAKESVKKAQRYFPASEPATPGCQDAFKEGDDIIAVDSDSDSGSDSSGILNVQIQNAGSDVLSSDGISDSDEEMSLPAVTPKRRPGRTQTDDSMEVDVSQIDLATLFPHTSTSALSHENAAPLSTFKPAQDENVFHLSVEEVTKLSLPPAPSSSITHSAPASLVLLPPHETICVLGTCNITVLHGSISILGTTVYPSPDSHRIFAPKSSPLPVIRCSFSKDGESLSLLSNVNLPDRITIDEDVTQHGAVLLFQELKTGVEGLGKICRPFLNAFEPSKWMSRGKDSNPFNLSGLSMVREQLSDVYPFVLPHTWSDALGRCSAALKSPEAQEVCNIYLVKGPKNTGKSTFARTLMNRLLETYERVAFLECDLGQSEFTPGGMVSLNIISRQVFGPPFTHPSLPVAAHYIGSSTPRASPLHYLESIQALLQIYRLEIQTPIDERLGRDEHLERAEGLSERIKHIIPLVVNTMGWSKGLGSDLTRKIEEWAAPTDVFTFEPAEDVSPFSTTLPMRRQPTSYGAFHGHPVEESDLDCARRYLLDGPPQAAGQSNSQFTAADHRTLTLLSYFHSVFPAPPSPHPHSSSLPLVEELSLAQLTAETWNTNIPLAAMRPYEIDASQALDRLVLTGSGSEDVVETEIGRVLNGAIVGLVSCREGAFSHWYPADEQPQQPQDDRQPEAKKLRLPYAQHCPAPDPANATCIGLGLVRAVHPRHLDGAEVDSQQAGGAGLQLLTPVPPAMLATTRVFVKGEMELPIWGMLDFRAWDSVLCDSESGGGDNSNGEVVEMEQGKTPYLQWGKNVAGAVGSEKKRVRRNLMRRGQM